ncbi:DUF3300 domain-containing protein [Paraburkholderia sp.]|uniref:DUF3300 domain-containing protein n=1 Tax=Paraburkholderia sp. TaxID=1926495 RepID=UPI0039E6F1C5
MKTRHRPVQRLIASSLLISMLGLSACGKKNDDAAQPAPAADTSAASVTPPASAAQPASATPVAYTPPTADQLYQMVAPIALFPDKLVALVLAGATYPDQITAANTWLAQNPNLKGQALATAADQQPWDPSVKALTAFPAVLSQMATNIAWTTSLGQAYYNDPTDVLNAIQVMRQRAQASGHLRTTGQMRVTQVSQTSAPADYTPAPNAPAVYEGPAVVPPPPQTIVIEPAQPDVVYVPAYNPAVVYGAPVAVYPGYVYHPPVYAPGAVVTAGLIGFGAAVTIGAVFGHVGWGWHAWGMHWGGPPPGGPGGPGPGGWQRPAVVYNHTTYVSRSTTVINRINNTHITNNYGNTVNNAFVHNGTPQAPMAQMHAQQPGPGAHPSAPMTVPHFSANDARPGVRPSAQYGPNHANANAMAMNHAAESHGNAMTSRAPTEGHMAGSPQVEHQPVPHPAPQNAAQFGHNDATQHPANAEPHPPTQHGEVHDEVARPPATAPREDAQQHAETHPQAPAPQPHPQPSRPHPPAPHPAPHHGEPHRQHRP